MAQVLTNMCISTHAIININSYGPGADEHVCIHARLPILLLVMAHIVMAQIVMAQVLMDSVEPCMLVGMSLIDREKNRPQLCGLGDTRPLWIQ